MSWKSDSSTMVEAAFPGNNRDAIGPPDETFGSPIEVQTWELRL